MAVLLLVIAINLLLCLTHTLNLIIGMYVQGTYVEFSATYDFRSSLRALESFSWGSRGTIANLLQPTHVTDKEAGSRRRECDSSQVR